MFPQLFTIGPFTVRTYGFLVAVGLFAALQYLLFQGRKKNIPENVIFDIVLYAVVAGLIGARSAYILLNAGYYAANPLEIFKIWEGGLVFYGGFAAGVAAVVLYIRKHREIPLWQLADSIAPALALGHFFGRLGCFFAGCCYGSAARLPWAVTFTHPLSLCPSPLPRHPVQLYEAAGNLLLFFLLYRYNRRVHADGRAFAWYVLGYGILRFGFEFLRGDERGSILGGMISPGQLISVAAVGIAVVLLRSRKQ